MWQHVRRAGRCNIASAVFWKKAKKANEELTPKRALKTVISGGMWCLRENRAKQWIKQSTLHMNSGKSPSPSVIPKAGLVHPATAWHCVVLLPLFAQKPGFPCTSAPCVDITWWILAKGLLVELKTPALTPSHLRPLTQVPCVGTAGSGLPAGTRRGRNRLHQGHQPCVVHVYVLGVILVLSSTGLLMPILPGPQSYCAC